MIRVYCSNCKHEVEVGDHLAGLTLLCKICGQRILVPGTSTQIQAAGSNIAPPREERLTHSPTHVDIPNIALDRENSPAYPHSPLTMEYIRAWLKTGTDVATLEDRLVAQGL